MTAGHLLVATETRFVRAADGVVYSTTGVDGYGFWTRYLDGFDDVIVAARTAVGERPRHAVPVAGARVAVTPLPDYTGAAGWWRTRRQLDAAMTAAVRTADALCLRAPGPIAGAAFAVRGARPVGVEVVGDPLDAFATGSVRGGLARVAARRLLAHRLRRICAGATAVAYVTDGALQRRYPTPAWSTVYSSIDLDEDAFAPNELLRRRMLRAGAACRGSERDPWRLAFVGSLAQPYKGLDVLLAALARCRAAGLRTTLAIAGDGRRRAELEATARRLDVAATFVGQQPAETGVRALLDDADAFVLPSRAEGLPRALIEAMARGLPCVASRVGGVPELLPDDDLVAPGDPLALATALMRLLHRGPLALAHDGRRHRDVARGFHRDVLQPRRRAFYARLRLAAMPARRPDTSAGEARGA